MTPIMKALMSATAVTALVAATPLAAQDSTPTDDPAVMEPEALEIEEEQPAMNEPVDEEGTDDIDTVQSEDVDDEAVETAQSEEAEEGPLFLREQAEEQTLASRLIGETVYNSAEESLGDINDIVLTDDGGTDAVVIGVGGFLGFGEKNVAVSFDAIDQRTDAEGNIWLTLDVTVEQLEAAPPFITLAEIRQQQQLEQQATQPGADPLAPAPAPAN